MEGGNLSAEQKRKVEKHPLTVSRTAKAHDLPLPKIGGPAPDPRTSAQQSGQESHDHATPMESSSSSKTVGRSRFYFESDALALKNNPDYRQLLQTLAVLEAQKMQAIRDMEALLHAQKRAEKDPLGFVESLKNGSLDPLPRRQHVVELPEIEWKGYIESLQEVAKQHSSMFLNTRRHGKPLITSLDQKMVASKPTSKSTNKSATYGQQWTAEEQARFEELLKVYPPEKVERKRFQKIAKALGTRTTQQVATHVQKYFIKLANAGLPVPGRMPNISKYSRKKGKGKRGLKRPSTFFSTLTPNVLMKEGSSSSAAPSSETLTYDSSDEESYASELISGESLGRGMEEEEEEEEEEEGTSRSLSPDMPTLIKCLRCAGELQRGVYWQCTECPQTTPTHLCNDCINSEYESQCHTPSHNMQLLSLVPPHTYVSSGRQGVEDTPTCFVDQDYTNFDTHGTQTGYNYLDPNFYPAN